MFPVVVKRLLVNVRFGGFVRTFHALCTQTVAGLQSMPTDRTNGVSSTLTH